MHSVFFTQEAKSFIDKLPLKGKSQIKNAVERIAQDPSLGKRLTQELSGLCSYRSGDYRIIYKTEHNKVLIIVLAIGHRKDIYKNFSRKFK